MINMSAGANTGGTYNIRDKWVDHIALNHDVHFVKSAGNLGNATQKYITSPGMAYNAITVGAYDTNDSIYNSDHTLSSFSSYQECNATPRAEKPNLVMPGSNYSTSGIGEDDSLPLNIGLDFGDLQMAGTSFAAPQVTGVIAQLCSQASGLKTKQTAMGAILAAGAYQKIQGLYNVNKGDSFINSVRLYNANNQTNSQLSNKEGAGALNAQGAWYIVWKGQYWGQGVNVSSFPYTKTVYINANDNDYIRVSIFWLMRNILSNSYAHSNPHYSPAGSFDDLNLTVTAPNGSPVATSSTSYSNFEIVQFNPDYFGSGYYTITITKNGTGTTSVEPLGIAVW